MELEILWFTLDVPKNQYVLEEQYWIEKNLSDPILTARVAADSWASGRSVAHRAGHTPYIILTYIYKFPRLYWVIAGFVFAGPPVTDTAKTISGRVVGTLTIHLKVAYTFTVYFDVTILLLLLRLPLLPSRRQI